MVDVKLRATARMRVRNCDTSPCTMAGIAPSTIISQIRHPHSAQQQISALKVLRNDIIGNQQRKDVWMASGVLEAVVEAATLRAPNAIDDQRRIEDAFTLPLSLNSLENVRLEALAVLGSFASGKKPCLPQSCCLKSRCRRLADYV